MPTYSTGPSPGRPPSILSALTVQAGSPVFLGRIVSAAGLATNNLSTATPFNATPRDPGGTTDTLAGKVLLVQPLVDGIFLATERNPALPGFVPITLQTGANPGPLYSAFERVQFTTLPTEGWVQWIPNGGGAGTLLVWELR